MEKFNNNRQASLQLDSHDLVPVLDQLVPTRSKRDKTPEKASLKL